MGTLKPQAKEAIAVAQKKKRKLKKKYRVLRGIYAAIVAIAQQEDKTAIFEEWCSFLNFFDSSIKFELSFVNMATGH